MDKKNIFTFTDKYIRKARIYPAVIGMLPTCILLAICIDKWYPRCQHLFGTIEGIIALIGGTALVSMAVGYFLSEIFRDTAKHLFQFPLFKEDETEMPTTQMLLWKNKKMATAYHEEIATKTGALYGIHLMTKEEESQDMDEAKRRIVAVVGQMKQDTRGELQLRQYNIEFGFCRNYLGASVWSLVFIAALSIANAVTLWLPWNALIVAAVVQLVAMGLFFMLLKSRGWAYAKSLIDTFMSKYK